MKTVTIDYNMTSDFRKSWTAINALREMAQNALDVKSDAKYVIAKGVISVFSNANLEPSAFALGQSTKGAGDIGGYGEGFKIGMLVLTRLGLNPTIATKGFTATGAFKANKFTGVDTFNITIKANKRESDGVLFMCKVGNIDIEDLKAKITPFGDNPLPQLKNKVEPLVDRPGMIFVNGLFVCENSKLVYGYNFSPDRIQLNSDRNMVGGLQWQLGEVYGNLPATFAAELFRLIELDAHDVQDVSYFLSGNKEMRAELVRLFFNKYGEGATIGKPGTSYIGSSNRVSCSSVAHRVYSGAGIKEAVKVVDKDAPSEVVLAFINDNKSKMRRDVRERAEKLVNRAKGWRKADTF